MSAPPPPPPTVLIVGAGLAGLLLAILLDQIDVPCLVLERAAVLKPLGSAMALGPNILPIFEQLNLLDALKNISKPYRSVNMYNQDLRPLGHINMDGHEQLVGYESLVFARPKLYELLLSQVPVHKINYNKKVVQTDEKDDKVHVYCADGSHYQGDILVGADGAYSSVRQSLYKQLDQKGILPKSDLKNFEFACINMVGVSNPQQPENYPQLQDEQCHFASVTAGLGDKGWTMITVPNNQICWILGVQLTKKQARAQRFGNAEWGPEAIDAMYNDFVDLPVPWGGTMGDIMKDTPKDHISKVFIEDKVFKTWYHGNTVLIGDACHKLLPGAGLGAVNAMHDAVVLANCIYNMKDSSRKSIHSALKEYYDQRYHRLGAHFKRSRAITSAFGGRNWIQRATRHMILHFIPKWAQNRDFVKSMEYRPQIAWLPLVPNYGKGRVLPQEGKRELLEDRQRRQRLEQLGNPDMGLAVAL